MASLVNRFSKKTFKPYGIGIYIVCLQNLLERNTKVKNTAFKPQHAPYKDIKLTREKAVSI